MVSVLNEDEEMISKTQSRTMGKLDTTILYLEICLELHKERLAAAAKNNTESNEQAKEAAKDAGNRR